MSTWDRSHARHAGPIVEERNTCAIVRTRCRVFTGRLVALDETGLTMENVRGGAPYTVALPAILAVTPVSDETAKGQHR